MITLPAPAKLNLFLHITGRRPDGFHNIQTIFQLIDLCDRLHFRLRNDGRISVQCSTLPDLSLEDFTVYKAAYLLPKKPKQGIDIQIEKSIPVGAGLGGGSSDAATTLLALNFLWQLELDASTLLAIGTQIGADVSIFIGGNTAWAEGIGNQLTALTLAPLYYLLIFPNCSVSTAEIFSAPQLTRDTPTITLRDFRQADSKNDCTTVTRQLFPEVDAALQWLGQYGEAKMSGTGSTCFVAFSNRELAEDIQRQVPNGWWSRIAEGINRSPLHQVLDNHVVNT